KLIKNDLVAVDNFTMQIISTDNLHCEGLKSCGVKIFDSSLQNIILSGDIKNLDDSQLLSFIDCNTTAVIQDLSFSNNFVHSTYEEVLKYYPKNLQDKIFGTHYDDRIEPDN